MTTLTGILAALKRLIRSAALAGLFCVGATALEVEPLLLGSDVVLAAIKAAELVGALAVFEDGLDLVAEPPDELHAANSVAVRSSAPVLSCHVRRAVSLSTADTWEPSWGTKGKSPQIT